MESEGTVGRETVGRESEGKVGMESERKGII